MTARIKRESTPYWLEAARMADLMSADSVWELSGTLHCAQETIMLGREAVQAASKDIHCDMEGQPAEAEPEPVYIW